MTRTDNTVHYLTDRWATSPMAFRQTRGPRLRMPFRWAAIHPVAGYRDARVEIAIHLDDNTALVLCCASEGEGNTLLRELVSARRDRRLATFTLDAESLHGDAIRGLDAYLV